MGEVITGGAGNDTISATTDALGLGAPVPATLNPGDMVDGGGGTDTANIVATSVAAPIPTGAVKNVEIINLVSDVGVNDFGTLAAGVNAGSFAGAQQVWQIGAAAPASVTGVTDGVTVGFNGTGALADLQMATGATTANVALKSVAAGGVMNIGETTAGTLTTANVNGSVAGAGGITINLDAPAATGGVAASKETTVNLGLSGGAPTVPATVTVTSTTATTIDASASTGHLAIGGVAPAVTTLKGGSGNDTLIGFGATKLIEGGAGADTISSDGTAGTVINGGAQGTVTNNALAPPANLFDAITLVSAANSEIVLTEAGHSGLTALTIDTIGGFVVGSDKLDFNLAAGSATNFLNGGPASGVTDALTNANTAMDGTVQYYASGDGAGNQLVFVDNNLDGTADMAVSATGIAGTVTFGDIIA